MIQVLPEVKSFAGEFSSQIGRGLGEGLSSGLEARKQSEALQKENKEIYDATGIMLSSRNPKMREHEFKAKLQGMQKEKERLADQEYLEELLGGKKGSSFQDQINQQPNQQSNQENERGFDPTQISDENIIKATARKPQLGAAFQKAKDVGLRENRAEREFKERQRLNSPEVKREQQLTQEQTKADVKYNTELQAASKQHQLKSQTLDRLDKLNKKGVTGKPFEKLLEKSGLIALTSDGRREFAADVKNLITDIRSILGSQFSQFEFQTILNAYPSPDFSKGANDSIIKNLQEFQDIRHKEFEVADRLKKENKGKIPEDFQAQVNEEVQQYAQSKLFQIKENTLKIMNEEYGIKPGFVLMFDASGEPLNVPENEVSEAVSGGANFP